MGKASASKLIHSFSSHPTAFGFWVSSYCITSCWIPLARRLISLWDIQIGIGTTAYVILQNKQLISHNTTVTIDTITSLQVSEWEVLPVWGVHELLTRIHDIQDRALSKWVRNTAHILYVLIQLQSNVVKPRLCSSLSFTVLRILLMTLMSLVIMVTLTGFWCRLSNNIYVAFHRLLLLWGQSQAQNWVVVELPKAFYTGFWWSTSNKEASLWN